MTPSWPENADARRVVAIWGQLLDEALLTAGPADATGLDWPDDSVIATTLAQWGGIADSTVDEAVALEDPIRDSSIAWLGGASLGPETRIFVAAEAPTAVDVPILEPVGIGPTEKIGPAANGTTRKHKVARPGQQATITGWTVHPTTTAGSGRRARRRVPSRDWSQIAAVAAAAAAVLLVGRQALATAPRAPGQTLRVLPAARDALVLPGPQLPGTIRPSSPVGPADPSGGPAGDLPVPTGQPVLPPRNQAPPEPGRSGRVAATPGRPTGVNPTATGVKGATTASCDAPLSPPAASSGEKSSAPVLAVGPPRLSTSGQTTTSTSPAGTTGGAGPPATSATGTSAATTGQATAGTATCPSK